MLSFCWTQNTHGNKPEQTKITLHVFDVFQVQRDLLEEQLKFFKYFQCALSTTSLTSVLVDLLQHNFYYSWGVLIKYVKYN